MSLTEVEYTLEGDLIIKEKRTGSNVYEIEYFYDSNVSINGANIANINPFRYRSYYYDKETGWYYLNSRYYNPLLCRFITMDSVEYLGASGSILSLNLYAYCENNPIMYVDPTGYDKEDWIIRFIFGLFTDLVLGKEPREAAKEYEENVIELGITENMIVFLERKIFIEEPSHNNKIGDVESIGNYKILNDYIYSSEDMKVICVAIAKHMGDESQSDRLYEEWMAHNYGYYVFGYDGLYSKIGSFCGIDGVESCKDVNFGIEPETGIRRIVLEIIYYYGSR